VQVGELRPRDRLHLGGRVELHRARAERDHRAVEREVLVGEPAQVAQHRGLRAVRVEHRVVRNGVVRAQVVGISARDAGVVGVVAPSTARRRRTRASTRRGRSRVVVSSQRDADVVGVDEAQVDAALAARGDDPRRAGTRDRDGVEEARRGARRRRRERGRGERSRRGVHARAIARRPSGRGRRRTSGHDRQQHLRGADVGRRLLAADVLLAGLQREAVRGCAVGVDGDADQAAGHLPLEPVAHRHVAGVRAAEAHRHAEALGRADDDVGAQLARAASSVSASRSAATTTSAPRSCAGSAAREVATRPLAPGYCSSTPNTSPSGSQSAGRSPTTTSMPERLGAGAHHVDRLRQARRRRRRNARRRLRRRRGQRHRLGGGGRLVEHRGVGDRQPVRSRPSSGS
jgi:hypothetical protein